MKRLVLLAAALLAACSQPAPQAPAVEGAWVRLAAVPGRPGAAYFTLRGGDKPARLIAITSPAVARIELHEGGMAAGMMTMRPLAAVDLPAGGDAALKPGGNHAMLFGVRPEVARGGRLPLTLRFADGATLAAEAQVVAAGDPPPEGP